MKNDLEFLYESIIINEMSDEVISYISSKKLDDLPFDGMFKPGELRKIVPLYQDETVQSILNSLTELPDFSKVDFKKGEVIRKIKLDPKYGKGDSKEQAMSIGKAIEKLDIPPNKKKEYLNWYARYKDTVEDILSGNPYAIIISRAPTDIVRMSDHRNISSCHSHGASHFHCAVQEALTGGAVAYLVNTKDVAHFEENPEDLQEEELFKDSERGVSGIVPVARLRIRRIEDPIAKKEYAIPEKRIYGNDSIPGFYDGIKAFLKSQQSINPKGILAALDDQDRPIDDRVQSRGGSYRDNDIESILTAYFDENPDYNFYGGTHDPIHSKSDYTAEAEHEEALRDDGREVMVKELNYLTRIANGNLNHFEVSFQMLGDEDAPAFSAWAEVNLKLPDGVVSEDFKYYNDSNFTMRLNLKDAEDKNSIVINTLLKDIMGMLKNVTFISADSDSIELVLSPEEEDIIMYDANDYECWIWDMKQLDKKYKSIINQFLAVLAKQGLANLSESDMKFSKLIDQMNESGESIWENYSYSTPISTDEFIVSWGGSILLPKKNMGFQSAQHKRMSISEPALLNDFQQMLTDYVRKYYKPPVEKRDDDQMTFSNFFESYQQSQIPPFSIKSLKTHLNYTGGIDVIFRLEYLETLNMDFINMVTFLDKHNYDIVNILKVLLTSVLDTDEESKNLRPTNIDQLNHAYIGTF